MPLDHHRYGARCGQKMHANLTYRLAKLACWTALLLIATVYMLSLRPHRFIGFAKLTSTPLSTTSFVRFSSPFATSTRYSSTNSASESSAKMSSITHIVLFQFKPDISPETILDVQQPFHCSSICGKPL